jgi:hypothetical protein
MSSQVLDLFVNEIGSPSTATDGSAMQWNGGPALLYAWGNATPGNIHVQISPDGGTTWIDVIGPMSFNSPGLIQAGFSQPAIMVRGVMGPNFPNSSSGLNMRLVGYDGT